MDDIRYPPQDEIRRSVALVIADALRFTEIKKNHDMRPILFGLQLLYSDRKIEVEEERNLFEQLLEDGWEMVNAYPGSRPR